VHLVVKAWVKIAATIEACLIMPAKNLIDGSAIANWADGGVAAKGAALITGGQDEPVPRFILAAKEKPTGTSLSLHYWQIG